MAERPTFDRSLFIPVAIGGLSLLGICAILIGLRLSAARASATVLPTSTPPRFQYLATEPGVVEPTLANTPTPDLSTDTPAPALPEVLPTSTFVFIETQPAQSTVTPPVFVLGSPTATGAAPQTIGVTYDDVDISLLYTGDWLAQSGVADANQKTLHVSNTIGNSVELVFFGQKVRFIYQAGTGLGQVALRLDTLDFALDQTATQASLGIWESPVLPLGNHTLTITHISGGAINVDSFVVVDLATPTVTITPTVTATRSP